MIPVSVVVMTRNEAVNLPHCLPALERFAERFVVDSGSTDGTPDIAAAAGARVVPFQWDGRHPKKKQWCLVKTLSALEAKKSAVFSGEGKGKKAAMARLCHKDAQLGRLPCVSPHRTT